MMRVNYRIVKEIATNELHSYATTLAGIADACGILKFAVYKGHGYWENELHDIIKIEFSKNTVFENKELKEFIDELDKAFSFGRSAVFVMYEEVKH